MTFNEMISQDVPVLVDFYADWCGPCKVQAPILEQVKAELGEAVKIYKIDVDKHQRIAMTYQVQSIPTLMFFKNGEVVYRHSGVMPAHSIQDIVSKMND